MKRCRTCGTLKVEDDFYITRGYSETECKQCHVARSTRARRKAARKTRSGVCVDCGDAGKLDKWSSNRCAKCFKGYNKRIRDEVKLQRRTLVNQVKSNPCMDCGIKYPPYVMDLDHRGHKLKDVSLLVLECASEERILAEVAKCDLVCANCHRLRTFSTKETT